MDNQNTPTQEKSILSIAVKGIALIVGLFILGNVIGSLTNIKRVDNFSTQNNLTAITEDTATTELTTLPPETTETTTTAPTTTKPTTTKPTTTEDVTPDTKEEIVTLFNDSANRIKTHSVKVIRNYEDRRYDEELSDYPIILNTVGRPLINSWLVKNDVPVEYTEKEIINANVPVKGKPWVSKLTADDIAEAKCTEKDGRYEIELQLLYYQNPAENKGPCAAMEEVNLEVVQQLAPIVKECSVEYYDCVIRATVDKESGNMVYIHYLQPMILEMVAGRFTDQHAIFAMTFESEYVIEY